MNVFVPRMYRFTSLGVCGAAFYRGVGGPASVENKRWGTPLMHAFLKAGKQLGYDHIDPNGPEQIGEEDCLDVKE